MDFLKQLAPAPADFFPANDLHSVQDVLRWTICQFERAGVFYGHGMSNAWDEAAYLIAKTLHLPLNYFDSFLSAALSQTEKNDLAKVIWARMHTRKPAAYLTGEAYLGEFRFLVNEDTIVPRSFFAELLAREAFAPWIEYPELVHSALDLCTGSGCLAILLAHYFPDAAIDAVDLSPKALKIAQQNVENYDLQTQITLHQGDLFAPLAGKTYDLILSNPPYVDAVAMQSLPQEYRHEPSMALASGEDGLDLVRQILQQASQHLNPHGVLSVEIGHQRDVLEAHFPFLPFTWLETESGDGFVFLISKDDLDAAF